MKKITSILVSLFILMSVLCVVAAAQGTSNNTYTFETEDAHYTVNFNDNNLSAEQQEIVAEKLVFASDDNAQTYGLGCILFGHDYKYTTVSVITHKARATKPRCKEDTYEVKYCEDCDFTEETLVGTAYIYCCD